MRSKEDMVMENKQEKITKECCKVDWFGGKTLAGVILIIVGLGFLLQNTIFWFSFNYVWPSIIVVVGLWLILRSKR